MYAETKMRLSAKEKALTVIIQIMIIVWQRTFAIILEFGKWRDRKLHCSFIASFELLRGIELKSCRAPQWAKTCPVEFWEILLYAPNIDILCVASKYISDMPTVCMYVCPVT